MLAKISGIKLGLRQIKKHFAFALIFLLILCAGYLLLLQNYKFNWSNYIKIFLDFAYPLGDTLYVFIATIVFLRLSKLKQNFLKNKILFVLLALFMECLSDYVFVLQANAKIWSAGNINDYMYCLAYVFMTIAILKLNSIKVVK